MKIGDIYDIFMVANSKPQLYCDMFGWSEIKAKGEINVIAKIY